MSVKAAKETLAPVPGAGSNLADYDRTYRTFDWKSVEPSFSWHKSGRVNIAHEAVDRHVLDGHGDRRALVYTDGLRVTAYTFGDLMRLSNRFANALTRIGVVRGDRVVLFMPRAAETAIGMLGILKMGAIPAPLSEALASGVVRDRMHDASAVALITHRDLLDRVPESDLPDLRHIVVVGADAGAERHRSFDVEMEASSETFETVWLGREDPLILHYTSGSTGKPKGVLHAQNAMIGHLQTGRWVLDLRPDDVVWCACDPGGVTGTAYGMFAPWLSGAASVMVGGRLDAEACYRVIEMARVTVWSAAPSHFRMLMAAGEQAAARCDRSSLRHILSAGEPLSPEIVRWGWRVYGQRLHDSWMMTEAGHSLISNYPSMGIRPGSMGKPIPGVEAAILDEHGHRVPPNTLGLLCIKAAGIGYDPTRDVIHTRGWPGMMRRVWNDPARHQEYFPFPGWYFSGDTATYDEDGYFWFQGRADDVILTDGERVGPFEVEAVLASHPAVADAGVIGRPDARLGQIIKAFIVLRAGFEPGTALKDEIAEHVKRHLAGHAAPREVEFRDTLPRGRNGRIARRVLKVWDQGLTGNDLPIDE